MKDDKPPLTVPGVQLLAALIEAEELTLEAFGAKVGVSDVTVHRWVKGKARPSYEKACEIARATGGKVSVAAFYPPAEARATA
ncbi:MAG TPA: helix-turn-helix transcriptional regulator [Pseudolabrys sp.]